MRNMGYIIEKDFCSKHDFVRVVSRRYEYDRGAYEGNLTRYCQENDLPTSFKSLNHYDDGYLMFIEMNKENYNDFIKFKNLSNNIIAASLDSELFHESDQLVIINNDKELIDLFDDDYKRSRKEYCYNMTSTYDNKAYFITAFFVFTDKINFTKFQLLAKDSTVVLSYDKEENND